jgi:hypothetical protein
MVKILQESLKSDFIGTIIDLETIGDFDSRFGDSRRCKNITPVIFGFIDSKGIKILCAKNRDSIEKLKSEIINHIDTLEKPFHAFNTDFERSVLFHHLSKPIEFEREINKEKFEKKEYTVQSFKIPNYDDPFWGDGRACMNSWLIGDINKAILHNRSCLLKERDILLKRGFRKPDELKLIG